MPSTWGQVCFRSPGICPVQLSSFRHDLIWMRFLRNQSSSPVQSPLRSQSLVLFLNPYLFNPSLLCLNFWFSLKVLFGQLGFKATSLSRFGQKSRLLSAFLCVVSVSSGPIFMEHRPDLAPPFCFSIILLILPLLVPPTSSFGVDFTPLLQANLELGPPTHHGSQFPQGNPSGSVVPTIFQSYDGVRCFCAALLPARLGICQITVDPVSL